MKYITRLLIIAGITISLFCSCSKDEQSIEKALIGTWISDGNWYGQNPIMKLISGGSLQYTNNSGETYSGTWSYNPSSNILTRTSSAWTSTKVDYVQSVSNTTLVLIDFDGDATSWHRQ